MLKAMIVTGVLSALAGHAAAEQPTSYRRSVDLEAIKSQEGERIAAHPGLVRRSGETLIVSYHGKTVFSDTDKDCDATDDCYGNYFLGTVDLYSPGLQRIETYAQIARMYWEDLGFFIIDEGGKLVPVSGEAVGSPDGRTIASGESFVDGGEDRTRLTMSRWDGKAAPVAFAPSCRPNRWNGNRELTALCEHWDDGGMTTFEGLARQDDEGAWTLKVVRVLSYQPHTGMPAVPIDGKVFKAAPVAE